MSKKTGSVLILGSGIAGLSCAIKFAQAGMSVRLIAKDLSDEGSTRYAQGGIASVWSKQDSFLEHEQDTLVAGAGLCNPEIVRACVLDGPARVQELIELGVEFTRSHDKEVDPAEQFDLHREGGHGKRRILHADDLTGLAIERALLAQVRSLPTVRIQEFGVAIDLITEGKLGKTDRTPGRCIGAYVLDSPSGRIETVLADLTILATGGAGKVYLYTSNPDTATGDGIAMAYRAGAKVSNLEFMQFHPTCLYHPAAKTLLISEALRGEGAVLRNIRGEEFMPRYHELGSLAPRDIVARAIDSEMKRLGDRHVLLDATGLGEIALQKKFPNIYEMCTRFGVDPVTQPIPVVPAAHYTCGGVKVDEWARSTIEGLFAVGEVACTGLHGANRLASNSLLEAVVFAHRAFVAGMNLIQTAKAPVPSDRVPDWDRGHAVKLEERIDIAANWQEIRTLMWNYVGIVRSNRRLARAKHRIELLKAEVNAFYWNYVLDRDLIELRNLLTVAELTVQCALDRRESRGLHYNVDTPERDDVNFLRDTLI